MKRSKSLLETLRITLRHNNTICNGFCFTIISCITTRFMNQPDAEMPPNKWIEMRSAKHLESSGSILVDASRNSFYAYKACLDRASRLLQFDRQLSCILIYASNQNQERRIVELCLQTEVIQLRQSVKDCYRFVQLMKTVSANC